MQTFLKLTGVSLVAMVMLTATSRPAYAGHDDGWETAGLVLAGIAAVGTIAAIVHGESADVHVEVGYNHRPPPPPRCEPPRRWIPAHYEVRSQKVVHPGHWEVVVEPARYGWVRHGHCNRYVLLQPACRKRVWVPERCEWVETRVRVAGHWELGRYASAR